MVFNIIWKSQFLKWCHITHLNYQKYIICQKYTYKLESINYILCDKEEIRDLYDTDLFICLFDFHVYFLKEILKYIYHQTFISNGYNLQVIEVKIFILIVLSPHKSYITGDYTYGYSFNFQRFKKWAIILYDYTLHVHVISFPLKWQLLFFAQKEKQ